MRLVSKFNTYKIFLFCLVAFTAVSCKSSYVALTIETPRPAKQELPLDIQSITLMNRSMDKQFKKYIEDSLQLHFYRNGYQLSEVVLDSMSADTTIRALAELLYESGRYDAVVPVERNIQRNLPNDSIPDKLSSLIVSRLCDQYNTDALMVMEQFTTKVMTDYSEDKYAGTAYSLYASLDLKYDALFRIYKPGSKTLEIQLSDTINWESADSNQLRMLSKLPSIKQALINAGIKIALDIDDKISPSWVPEKRGYYLFDLKNDSGQQLLNENKIQEVRAFWMKKTQSTKKSIKSKAEYNLALASELEGNVDQAIEWILKSYYTLYNYRTELYLKKLRVVRENQLTK